MARSYHQIVMDFNTATRQANNLDDVADQLGRMSDTQFENTLRGLADNWTGDNAHRFIGKGVALQGQMGGAAASLRQTAQAIREIAQVIYEAEMEAWERAHD